MTVLTFISSLHIYSTTECHSLMVNNPVSHSFLDLETSYADEVFYGFPQLHQKLE